MLVPILGDMTHAEQGALADGHMRDVLAAKQDLPVLDRLKPRQAVDQLRLTVAVDAGDADDLTRTHLKRYVVHGVVLVLPGGDRQVLHVEQHVARRARLFLHVEIDAAPDHHGRKLLGGGIFRLDRADALALAQNGAAVGHGHDLLQLVRDEQDRLALGREPAHDLHQLADLLRGEHGGRLVEDEDLIVAVEHLEDLGALLHTDGDVLDARIRIDLQAVFFRQREHLFARLALLQEAMLRRLDAHDDIVQHREALDQLEVLVHHADAEAVGVVRVFDGDDLAVLADLALLGLIQAEQDGHERGLAGAVFAEQRMDLPLAQLERDVVIGHDAREALRDVQHFNGIGCVQRECPPSVCIEPARTKAGTESICSQYTIVSW